MSAGIGKCSKIRHIVRLRQMLRRWRNKARMSANRIPSDVPAGHVAVCVGTSCRRFVVRATVYDLYNSGECMEMAGRGG
ncbi:hypothetical protein GH714_006506 [Hevea brasiliensis]|uniref:Uncharacterized protein n=1 Tax=Hevea brasiliensis TaxID=3981 RepID=A0A6A6M8M3_HEVBR|nr:hypothetical protein GH714_006506 [Hevea brasiliensis]